MRKQKTLKKCDLDPCPLKGTKPHAVSEGHSRSNVELKYFQRLACWLYPATLLRKILKELQVFSSNRCSKCQLNLEIKNVHSNTNVEQS